MRKQKGSHALQIGNDIEIWWPRDQRAYKGEITRITDTHLDVAYTDGCRKTYPLDALLAAGYGTVG